MRKVAVGMISPVVKWQATKGDRLHPSLFHFINNLLQLRRQLLQRLSDNLHFARGGPADDDIVSTDCVIFGRIVFTEMGSTALFALYSGAGDDLGNGQ